MMKYIVRPLYIREAIIYGDLQSFETVKWDEIHQSQKIENDGKETLGDILLKDSLWCKDFNFPKLHVIKCLVASNDLYEDYSNFNDFEDVDSFLHNNDSDWQEGGLYNAAHVVTLDEDNIIEQSFYSVNTRSFVEVYFSKKQGTIHLTKAHRLLMEQKKFCTEKVVFKQKEVKPYRF